MFNWLKNTFSSSRKSISRLADGKTSLDSSSSGLPSAQSLTYKIRGDECLNNDDWNGAAKFYLQAVITDAQYAEAHINLGFVLAEQRQFETAKYHLQQALTLNPQLFDARYVLASICEQAGEIDNAIDHLKIAVVMKPDFAEAFSFLARLYRDQGNANESVNCYRKALEIDPTRHATHTGFLFSLQYSEICNQAEIFAEHLKFSEKFETPLKHSWHDHPNELNPNRRLKVGYVSSDFRAHSVALFMLPIFENHDKNHFEIFCYYSDSFRDGITQQISLLADHFVFCESMSDGHLADRIRSDGIDVLVDLNGHTGRTRLLTFARKPAPIQASYLGYVDTTGLSSMDYRLTNIDADPPGNERFYSEKLYRFTDGLWWCYRPAANLPNVTPLPAMSNGFVTFVSANNIAKISQANIAAWANILHALPNSRLMLMAVNGVPAQHAMEEKFSTLGVDGSRLVFHGRMPLEKYRELLIQADIALDTFPFNGGTTSCETLSLGLPLISMYGASFVSRMGYALLKDLNLSDLAVVDTDEYVNVAVELAKDIDRLSVLRQGMRARIAASTISDEIKFTRNLETAYRGMWQAYIEERSDEH